MLERYDKIVPGAAERIIGMAERQASHRQSLEKEVIASDIRNSGRGLLFGFLIGLVGIGGGAVVSIFGQPGIGVTISIVSLVSLVGVFVYGSQQRRKEREDKKFFRI